MNITGIGQTTPRNSAPTSTETKGTVPPSNTVSTISSYAVSGTSKLFFPFSWILSTVWRGFKTIYNFFFPSKNTQKAPSEKKRKAFTQIPALPFKHIPAFPSNSPIWLGIYTKLFLTYLNKIKNTLVYNVITQNGEVKQETGFESMKKNTEVISLEDLNMTTKEQFIQAVKQAAEESYGDSLPNRTNYKVVNTDSVDTALNLDDPRPLVLSMADEDLPGGRFQRGVKGQEEDICRRTALYHSISPQHNPYLNKYLDEHSEYYYEIPEYGCIYSPSVPIFHRNYKAIKRNEKIPSLCFVSSAAYNLSKLGNYGASQVKDLSLEEYEKGTRLKIRAQIYTAVKHGHKSIILGAFGCGGAKNDSKLIARLYQEELAPVQKYFENIVFAILGKNNRDRGNYNAFRVRFGSLIERWTLG